jgi:hypothetical protein
MTEGEVMMPVDMDLVEPAYEDYFGFETEYKHYLPDGKQYLVLTKMNEGARKRFQSETRSDLTLERTTGNARMRMDPGSQRWTLLECSVTGWYLMRKTREGWKEVPFTKQAFPQWLGGADPVLVDALELAIRKLNPWLLQEMSVGDIDKEIANLQEMREAAVKREQGEESSSGK